MKSRLEKDFVNNILLPRLKKIPRSFWYKPPTAALAGIPDLLGCIEGRFVGLECKREGAAKKKHEKLQVYVCDQIRKAGGVAFTRVHEGNFENVILFLRGKQKEYGEPR